MIDLSPTAIQQTRASVNMYQNKPVLGVKSRTKITDTKHA